MTPDASSAYRRTDGHSAGPIRLVIMLYEQLIKDLQSAVAAMKKKMWRAAPMNSIMP